MVGLDFFKNKKNMVNETNIASSKTEFIKFNKSFPKRYKESMANPARIAASLKLCFTYLNMGKAILEKSL